MLEWNDNGLIGIGGFADGKERVLQQAKLP